MGGSLAAPAASRRSSGCFLGALSGDPSHRALPGNLSHRALGPRHCPAGGLLCRLLPAGDFALGLSTGNFALSSAEVAIDGLHRLPSGPQDRNLGVENAVGDHVSDLSLRHWHSLADF